MSIITVAPKIRQKGFDSIDVKSINNQDFEESFNKITNIVENIKKYNLSLFDQDILNKIKSSYLKIKQSEKLLDDDMILKNHECLEMKSFDDMKAARYFIYRYKFNIFPKIKKIGEYPPCIQLEPTSVCNFRCVMCYQADKTFSGKSNGFMGMMSMDVFKKCIDELEGNVEAITFASRGEPTLNKNFEKMMEYANGKFLGLKLNTNASMLTEKMAHTLLSSDLQTIVFSIDSKDKDAYEKIRINGKFEKVVANLERFNHIRNTQYSRSDKIVRISGVKINDKQDIDEMKKQWGDVADIIAFTNYTPWESSYDNPENNISSPCSELWQRMFIWQDGKANPCDYDYKSTLSKWSIKDQSIKSIWNSAEYDELRRKHLNNSRNELEPCKRCIHT